LRNLISNAIKYSEEGEIVVHAKSAPGDQILFSVVDTGIGVAPENQEYIFEDFTQVDSRFQKRTKGTGLGLPLSRKLARLLGGELWVESGPGTDFPDGSAFHARIPRLYDGQADAVLFNENTPINKPADDSTDEGQARFKVLIVDDDEPSRYVLKSFLRAEMQADFIEAVDGRDGFEKAVRLRPDLIFLDLNMPRLDGFEFLREFSGRQRLTPEIGFAPIIVNTARVLNPFEHEFLMAKAVAVLSKDRTDSALSRAELKKALRAAGFDMNGAGTLSEGGQTGSDQ
jgi:CheY-like chemotaxis protein